MSLKNIESVIVDEDKRNINRESGEAVDVQTATLLLFKCNSSEINCSIYIGVNSKDFSNRADHGHWTYLLARSRQRANTDSPSTYIDGQYFNLQYLPNTELSFVRC